MINELCFQLVTRFAQAMKDPAKVAELKAILGFLCHETSYIEECKVFVSKLDYFLQRLEPYLVCFSLEILAKKNFLFVCHIF